MFPVLFPPLARYTRKARSIPAGRDGIGNVLIELNITSTQKFLDKCLGLSLSDQYWICPVDSSICWPEVNFFEHIFSDDVGNILFGKGSSEAKISLMSPDNTADSDPINMISGSTGIAGAVDGIFILEKDNRMDNKAKLHITGRDIEDLQMFLEFDRENSLWNFVSYLNNPTVTNEKIVKAVAEFMSGRKEWKGISTALLEELRKIDSTIETRPNMLTRVLKEEILTMRQRYEIAIEYKRVKSARQITLKKKVTVTA